MLESIYVTQPKTFREQLESVVNIHDYLPSGVGLVVCDDFTYLHRLEISGKPAQTCLLQQPGISGSLTKGLGRYTSNLRRPSWAHT
jgi:hypothetical protein